MIAEAYYKAMGKKDFSEMEKYLHPDVQFRAPLAQTKGKQALLEGVKGFCNVFSALRICDKFENGDKAVIVYELDCKEPIGLCRSVALLGFTEELISNIELFYDARPFVK